MGGFFDQAALEFARRQQEQAQIAQGTRQQLEQFVPQLPETIVNRETGQPEPNPDLERVLSAIQGTEQGGLFSRLAGAQGQGPEIPIVSDIARALQLTPQQDFIDSTTGKPAVDQQGNPIQQRRGIFLGDIGSVIGEGLQDTFGRDTSQGMGPDELRTIAGVNQAINERQRAEKLKDFGAQEKIRAANRAPSPRRFSPGEAETQRLEARKKFGTLPNQRKTTPRKVSSRDRLTSELNSAGFIQTPLGVVDSTTGERVRTGNISPERLSDFNNAVLRAGTAGSTAQTEDPDPAAPLDPQSLKEEEIQSFEDALNQRFQDEEDRLGRPLTPEEEDQLTLELSGG